MTIAKKPLLHKGSNKYYGLTAPELRHLYSMGLLKSIAYVYLALKLENPWCDRPVTIEVKEFALAWGIKQSTLYRAIALLADQGLVKFGKNKLNITWVVQENSHEPAIKPHHKFQQVRKNSNMLEKIPTCWKKFQHVGKNSNMLENESLEPLPDKDCSNSHTIHTIHTDPPPYSEVEEKILKVEKITPSLVSPPKKKQVPKVSPKSVELPSDLAVRLKDLDIEIDQTLIAQINQYHLSQVYGSLYHVESTIDSIDCAKAVFLYQLPKQPIEKLGDRLGQIYLDKAIAFEKDYQAMQQSSEFKQASNEAFASIKDILARSKLSGNRGNNRV